MILPWSDISECYGILGRAMVFSVPTGVSCKIALNQAFLTHSPTANINRKYMAITAISHGANAAAGKEPASLTPHTFGTVEASILSS